MHFSNLPKFEAGFLATGNKGEYTFKKIAIPVKGENLILDGMFCTPVNRTAYFHAVEHPKERILLHFTAGQIRSDMSALTRDNFHVSTPFVIGRDGTIYQLYSSKFWSGNIGKGIGNVGNTEDKKTIGIEISNYGFLTERDGNLETIYSRLSDALGRPGLVDVYCSLNDTDAYQKITTPFRGQQYYATFTPGQYESLIVLLRYLTAQYNIPRQFLPENKRYISTNDVLSFKGIVSHVNYRDNGKWDIGPAFDWNKVISGVQAASFQPSLIKAATRDVIDELVIRSEEELEKLMPTQRSGEEVHVEGEDIDSTAVIEKGLKKKNLYALVVGIDDYDRSISLEGKVVFGKLRGCVNDATKMKAYLQTQAGFEAKIKTLFNKEATKEGIVEGFQTHLLKAEKDDTVLFYYSGHGTQEWADREVWKGEIDGRLECLACYYDEETKEKFLLADKELRFLIKGLAEKGAHVVAIFDCCNSGDNTRNGHYVKYSFSDAVDKRIPFSFKQRAWDDFIFSKELKREDVLKTGEAETLPEGLHIQLAACENDESAVEVSGEGVFTKALIETLQAADGDITYQALRSRVRQYLRNIYEQKPKIYAVHGDETLLYTTFLNRGAGEDSRAFGDVLYNEQDGWLLSLGAIEGLGENTKKIRVLDPSDGNKEYLAAITKINTGYSTLQLPDKAILDKKRVYRGYVENLLKGSVRVCLNNVDGLPRIQETLMQGLASGQNDFIMLDEKEPQYTVHNHAGQFYITEYQNNFRPLTGQVKASKESVNYIVSCLKHIAEWERLKGLSNKGANGLDGNEIDVKIAAVKNGKGERLSINNSTTVIEYQKTDKGWQTTLEIELTNTTQKSLYCGVLYLTYAFGSLNKLMPSAVKKLDPGDSVKLEYEGNTAIPFEQRKVVEWYNWEERIEYLKLIVSTTEIDVAKLTLESLPSPVIPKPPTRAGERSLGTDDLTDIADEYTDTRDIDRWGTQTIIMRQPNPAYKKIGEKKVLQMMQDERTEGFAVGLYFDVEVNHLLPPTHKLKGFVIPDPAAKSIIGETVLDLANWWSRRKRNRLFEEMKKDPNRVRIFSEGDSWFQHPLVHDIIDHLSRTYAVFCSSAAGDTLRNYQSAKNERGKYYLDAIREINPDFFLFSGGGNDILGSKFRDYLNDKFDESRGKEEKAMGYLRQEIFKEIDSLTDIYRQIFRHLQLTYPKLQIIVHGYDYPVKLDDDKKGWLGRYMIEKGIRDAADRKNIIRKIMNYFNDRLKEVALEFQDTVSYIDLRGTVRYDPNEKIDQWYDEIHPNDEGFQQVAMKFIAKISEKNECDISDPKSLHSL
jgi:N-acetyl-anhydromuramyl-L-alanine amidase AmpD/lysophospholipase L1-like esterase